MKIVSVESYEEAEELLMDNGYFNENGTWGRDGIKSAFIAMRDNNDLKYNLMIVYLEPINP